MKKICLVCPAVYPLLKQNQAMPSAGGAEAQLKTLGFALAERGCEVHFIVDEYGQQDTEKIGKVTIHKVPLRYLGGKNRHLVYDWVRLLHKLSMIQADIHLLKVPKDLLLPVGIFCKLCHKKLVFIGQSDKDVDFSLLFRLQNKLAVLLYRIGLFFVDYTVAQNYVQVNGFAKMGLPCQLIRNVITLPLENGKKEGYILWVGNSTANKQPSIVPKLALKFPEYRFKMILATTIQEPNDGKFRELSSKIPNFKYVGFVPFSQIAEYYRCASLFVNTSLREGFPNTFLQAWQFSTPVVSLHIDPDCVIRKRELGRISGTFEKLCNDIRELMDDEALRQRMGKNAKEYVESHHSVKMIVDQYLELFDRLST